jgi:hypothetical protein
VDMLTSQFHPKDIRETVPRRGYVNLGHDRIQKVTRKTSPEANGGTVPCILLR